jgi:glycerol dehydrogenase
MEGQPQSEIREIFEYCQSVGLPTTLQQIGINPDDNEVIQRIAERTVIPGESSHNEPFEVTAAAVADAIRAADQQGRAYIN